MAKNKSSGPTGKSERIGYQPLNEGYVPHQKKGYVAKPSATYAAEKLPPPPKGGTGTAVSSTSGSGGKKK